MQVIHGVERTTRADGLSQRLLGVRGGHAEI
jgi:hypothetical protein